MTDEELLAVLGEALAEDPGLIGAVCADERCDCGPRPEAAP